MRERVLRYYFLAFIVFFSSFGYAAIPPEERAALIALYNSTDGDNWTNNNGWKTPPLDSDGFAMPGTEGTWNGIYVTDDHVTKVQLYHSNLTGNIPEDIETLSYLEYLNLGSNQLEGTIPIELCNLKKLRTLRLELNQLLAGDIPEEIGRLSNLEVIYLYWTNISGSIPKELGQMKNLIRLDFHGCQLSGNIPQELGYMNSLQYMYLHQNKLTGEIPSQLENLKNLLHLSLYDNQLTGDIPPELGNLSKLYSLSLSYNQLTGSIPPELSNLINLSSLSLSSNQLTGTIPRELGNLANLTSLGLSSNQLTGTIPPELENLTNLRGINLSENQFNGTFPDVILKLQNLRSLFLSSNQLMGNIPREIKNLQNMQYLYLNDNQFTGIPPEIGKLSKLHNLMLYNNKLSGNIPDEIGLLIKLDVLALHRNQLTGNIPPEIGQLKNLDQLYLDNNQLTGSIPPSLGNLSNLIHLRLNNNKLSGEIPTTLMNLTRLYNYFYYVNFQYNCLFTNDPQLKEWLDYINPGWEEHQSECNLTSPIIFVNRTRLNIGYTVGSNNLSVEKFIVNNVGGGTLNWTVSTDMQRILLIPASGKNTGTVSVDINPIGLVSGKYNGSIQISDPSAVNSPQEVIIKLLIKSPSESVPPIGHFSTPLDGAAVFGSVPVTGWALSEMGIDNVKIYREENSDLVYLGNAIFVEGSRPDIEAAFPDYPSNYKAGWGYMLLTNFLPSGGNGAFKIHAIATDKEGLSTDLGTRTINVDNANAVKPFGAIDRPIPGGTVFGSESVNFAWVLTPQPNSIPVDGSTIRVVVDGVNIGKPIYNIYREDIATLFPGYANTNGAVGYFILDTTTYENGIHTIQWLVTDSGGNTDGIGSRYFNIQNASGISSRNSFLRTSNNSHPPDKDQLINSSIDHNAPLLVKGGLKSFQLIKYPNPNGLTTINIQELGQLEIQFPEVSSVLKGYMLAGNQHRPLPIGSTLDRKTNTFYWQPGVGFNGQYRFVFIEKRLNGELYRRDIQVDILTKLEKNENVSGR